MLQMYNRRGVVRSAVLHMSRLQLGTLHTYDIVLGSRHISTTYYCKLLYAYNTML